MIWFIIGYLLGVGTVPAAKFAHERYWPKLQAVLRQVF